MVERGAGWPLLCLLFLCSLPHQLAYNQYYRRVVEKQTYSTKLGYQVVLQNPTWIRVDVEFDLHHEDISLVPILNIICPKFCSVPIPSSVKNNIEPFSTMPLYQDLNEARAAAEQS